MNKKETIDYWIRQHSEAVNKNGELEEEIYQLEAENERLEEKAKKVLAGWMCPVCGSGNSPYATVCRCGPNYRTETASTTSPERR